MCSVMVFFSVFLSTFCFDIKVKIYIKKDVFLLTYEHLLIPNNTRPIKRNLMPLSISRTPDFSNQFGFPLEDRFTVV